MFVQKLVLPRKTLTYMQMNTCVKYIIVWWITDLQWKTYFVYLWINSVTKQTCWYLFCRWNYVNTKSLCTLVVQHTIIYEGNLTFSSTFTKLHNFSTPILYDLLVWKYKWISEICDECISSIRRVTLSIKNNTVVYRIKTFECAGLVPLYKLYPVVEMEI